MIIIDLWSFIILKILKFFSSVCQVLIEHNCWQEVTEVLLSLQISLKTWAKPCIVYIIF